MKDRICTPHLVLNPHTQRVYWRGRHLRIRLGYLFSEKAIDMMPDSIRWEWEELIDVFCDRLESV